MSKGASVKADRVTIVSRLHVNLSSAITATLIPKCTEIKSRRLCRNLIRDDLTAESLANELSNYSLAVIMKHGQSKLNIDRDAGRLQARRYALATYTILPSPSTSPISIVLCADSIQIAGEISTSGQGCLSDSGFGTFATGYHSPCPLNATPLPILQARAAQVLAALAAAAVMVAVATTARAASTVAAPTTPVLSRSSLEAAVALASPE